MAKVKRFLGHLVIDMGFNRRAFVGKTLTAGKEALIYLQIYATLWYKLDYM